MGTEAGTAAHFNPTIFACPDDTGTARGRQPLRLTGCAFEASKIVSPRGPEDQRKRNAVLWSSGPLGETLVLQGRHRGGSGASVGCTGWTVSTARRPVRCSAMRSVSEAMV